MIFASPEAKQAFFEALAEAIKRFKLTLHIHCLMENHFHLLVQVAGTPLHEAMHWLQSQFAHWYNRRFSITGHVFERRYRAILCTNDRYLLALLRYIHRNPVAAGLVRRVEDWPWSSHRAYLGAYDPLVTTELCLSLFGDGRPAREAYAAFIDARAEAKWPHEGEPPEDDGEVSHVLGLRASIPPAPLDRLIARLRTLSREAGVAIPDLAGPAADRRLTELRRSFAGSAVEDGFSLAEIGTVLGRSKVAIFKALRHKGLRNG